MPKIDVFGLSVQERSYMEFPLTIGTEQTVIKLRNLDALEQIGAEEFANEICNIYINGGFNYFLPDGTKEWRDKPIALELDRSGSTAVLSPLVAMVLARIERMQGIVRVAGAPYNGDGYCFEELCAIAAKYPEAWLEIQNAVSKVREEGQKKDSPANTDS